MSEPRAELASGAMRLGKHLAHAGVASRRASEALVVDGRVTVDGAVVTDPARGVSGRGGDRGRRRARPRARAPASSMRCTSRPAWSRRRPTRTGGARSSTSSRRASACTRSAASTPTRTGLILLTNDGDLAYALTHPRFEVPRTYRARVEGRPSERALRALREGVELEDGRTAPAHVRLLGPHELELTIHEGRKRQVRRMCEAVGHRVVDLRRVAFGSLRLGDLAAGRHRRLTAAEVERLRRTRASLSRARSARRAGRRRPRSRRTAAMTSSGLAPALEPARALAAEYRRNS